MIRVVFDTNVIVSAAWTRGGAEAYALDLAAANKLQLYATEPILSEYETVLRRPKFSRLPPELIDKLIELIRGLAIIIVPFERLAVSPDEDDNRFLECAEAADAHYLVTGNKRHFPHRWKRTTIINARELIEMLIDPDY
jgi:putative PIN family toxin of toxin-antitoxin system